MIREHANLPLEATGPEESKGRAENGDLYEQPICISAGNSDGEEGDGSAIQNGLALRVRRIRLVLDEPTRDGETEIVVVTSVPGEEASAEANEGQTQTAHIYRGATCSAKRSELTP